MLTFTDQKLISGYQACGKHIDELPYTQEFEQILRDIGITNPSNAIRAGAWKRLRWLYVTGYLPK